MSLKRKGEPILTFKRGIHPNEQKQYTENVPINYFPPPAGSEIIFPLVMHLGAPCNPLVEKGQKVLLGEKIADSDAFVCAPIHSSVSGVVKDIRPHLTVVGTIVNSIIVENDGELKEHESIKPRDSYDDLSGAEIVKIIRESGIVGLGGAGFPTHVKLSPPPGKKIDTVIVNGCECEPYLTTDNRVMIEESFRIVTGLKILLKVIQGATGIIAVEDNKPEAIESLRKACDGLLDIKVAVVKTKYPQGCEKQLVTAITEGKFLQAGYRLTLAVL